MSNEPRYINGMKIREQTFDNGGTIIHLGIDMTRFYEENPTNERGYLNIDIKRSKEKGTLYAVLNTYEPKKKAEETQDIVSFGDLDEEEEIPF